MLALAAVGQGIKVEGFGVLSTRHLEPTLNDDSHLAGKGMLGHATAIQR